MSSKRVKTPVYLQMEATECGAASLGIVAHYYGVYLPLERLRELCGVSRNGSTAVNIMRAATKMGFKAEPYSMAAEALKTMEMPLIIHWEFRHFLVLEGYDEQKGIAYLNDPELGHRKIKWSELEESFTGVVLSLTPGPHLMEGEKVVPLYQKVYEYLSGSWRNVTFLSLVAIATAFAGICMAVTSQFYFDQVFSLKQKSWLYTILFAFFAGAVVNAVLSYLRSWMLNRWLGKMAVDMAARFVRHVLRLPWGFFQQRYVGEVASRIQLNDYIASFLTGEMATVCVDIAIALFYLVLLLCYSVKLTLVGLCFAVLNILLMHYISQWLLEEQQKVQQANAKTYGLTIAGLNSISSIKAGAREQEFFAKWQGAAFSEYSVLQGMESRMLLVGLIPSFLSGINNAIVMAVGGISIIDGIMTLGVFIAFQNMMKNFQEPLDKLVGMYRQVQQVRAQINRVDDVFRYPVDPSFKEVEEREATSEALLVRPEAVKMGETQSTQSTNLAKEESVSSQNIASAKEESALTQNMDSAKEESVSAESTASVKEESATNEEGEEKLRGFLDVKALTFGYSKTDSPLIRDFTMHLDAGARVAIVGGSGSGKSTLAKLIVGLYQPNSGEILFDGKKRESLSPRVLANSIGHVEQDIFLFESTVAENISMYDGTIPREDIVAAARDACIHREISLLPGGYDAMVSEGGTNLSGGQCQRLEIARALAKNPSIVVFDEATSSLDAVTEKKIMDNVRRRGCSCVLIAHRLSTVRDCDEIIVLQAGRIAQRGSHQKLMEQGGAYRDLINDEQGEAAHDGE